MIKRVLFKFLKAYLLICLFVGCSLRSMADCGITINPEDCFQDPDNPEDTPLDSGVVFLVIAGMAFSIVAIKKNKMEVTEKSV